MRKSTIRNKNNKAFLKKISLSFFYLCMFVLAAALLSSFSPPPAEVEGYPEVYGNEPHTFIGIKTLPEGENQGAKYYRIVCSWEEEKAIREMQGFVIQVRGRIISREDAFYEYAPDILSDGVIILSSWKRK
ncbi:MAG: hypothetical protein K5930_02215 [Treponemataceae bacterium]|nr:hypothetical protein [Treponemataceae bacterium]